MKKLLYLLLILPLLSISCSSDNDDYSNSDIVGTWVLESVVAKDVITNNDSATQAIKKNITDSEKKEVTLTFTADGKFTTSDSDDDSRTYSLSGNKLIIKYDEDEDEDEDEPLTSEISISENNLSMNTDETDIYKEEILYMVPNGKDVVVSKVITTYSLKRK